MISRAGLALLTMSLVAGCSANTEPADDGDVSFVVCDATWVAAQDGDGAWTRIEPAGSTYDFSFRSGRGGIAKVRNIRVDGQNHLDVFYGTVTELRQAATWPDVSYCSPTLGMTGTVVVDTLDLTQVEVHLGSSYTSVGLQLNSFTIFGYPGMWDMVARQVFVSGNAATRMIVRRNVEVVAGGMLATLDFGSPEAFSMDSATATVTGLNGDQVLAKSTFFGSKGATVVPLPAGIVPDGATPARYEALPASRFAPGDFQLVEAVGYAIGRGARRAGVYTRSPSPRTLTLGPDLDAPIGSIIDSQPNLRMSVQVVSQSQYARTMMAHFEQGPGVMPLSPRNVEVTATAAYFGAIPSSWTITIPDLSGAAGWDPTWGLSTEALVTWSMKGAGGAIPVLDRSVADGATTQSGSSFPQ